MTLEWEQVIVHSLDPVTLGRWWADALGWVVVHSSADEFEIRPAPDHTPGLDFVRLDEGKKAKADCTSTSGLMTRTPRWIGWSLTAHGGWTSARGIDPGWCWLTPKAMSSASLAHDGVCGTRRRATIRSAASGCSERGGRQFSWDLTVTLATRSG